MHFIARVNFDCQLPAPPQRYWREKLSQRVGALIETAIDCLEITLNPQEARQLGQDSNHADLDLSKILAVEFFTTRTKPQHWSAEERAAAVLVHAAFNSSPKLWYLVESGKAEVTVTNDIVGVSIELGWPEDTHPNRKPPLTEAVRT